MFKKKSFFSKALLKYYFENINEYKTEKLLYIEPK